MGEEQPAKRVRRDRVFTGAMALDTESHYYVQWRDFEECLELLVKRRKWLLISGPFQSGKSSLAYALADAAIGKGFVSFITTVTPHMVRVANDPALSHTQASDAFFGLLAEKIEIQSRGALTRVSSSVPAGCAQVVRMFQLGSSAEPDVVWFIDEAALLNEIRRPDIIRDLLSGLRSCKEESTYRLRSFSLVGTAKTSQLLASAREQRMIQYVPSSPTHDPFNPFPPGLPISPLSLEKDRSEDYLSAEDILGMLRQYGHDHGVSFRVAASTLDSLASENEQGLKKFADSIYDLTSGYKGMVGSCCEYIQGNGICSFWRWKQDLRKGAVASHVLYLKVYARIVSNIPTYSKDLQQFVLDCVASPSSGQPYNKAHRDVVLPAVNDGVLSIDRSREFISISSGILLAAILEDCSQATREEVPILGSFEEALRASFRYMKPDRLSRPEVLNRNGQPSEYIWQFEFLLGLKLVLERGYRRCKYTILVKCKRRDKNGERKVRVDFYAKNAGSPPKAFEVQAKGGAKSIRAHLIRSEKYRLLSYGCEMNYVYFVFGHDAGTKAVIAEEAKNFKHIKCWFVQYFEEDKVWNVELLQESGWHSVRLDVPPSYPEFKFATRQA